MSSKQTLPPETNPPSPDPSSFLGGEHEGNPPFAKEGSPRTSPSSFFPPSSPSSSSPSRTQHSTRNGAVGIACQMLTMVLAFVVRKVLMDTLGEEYAGISGWFSAILSVLGISELGIGTAIVVSLYRPLAQGDTPRVRATLRMLRQAYHYVGLAVLGLGLLLLPFLPALLNQRTDLVNIRAVYLLFLAQSVFSYLFCGYKSAIFTADQRQSRIHVIGALVSVLSSGLQIAALVLWRNYYVFAAAYPLSVMLKNLLIARSANKEYSYLRDVAHPRPDEDDEAALPSAERKSIFKNLFGLSLYRISGTALNATDALVLTGYIGLAMNGIYSNHMMVVTAAATLLTMLFQSFTASVGNLHVTAGPDRQHFIYRCLNLMGGWLYGFAAICLLVLLEPFITLLYGADTLFADARVVPVIALNFLTSGLLENTIMHKDACGLFWQGRFRPVFSAGLNIVLSLWWVHPLGVFGVILATVASRLLTTWWFDPWMVHHYAFHTGVKGYYAQTLLMLGLAVLCGAGLKWLTGILFPAVTMGSFLLSILLCILIPNVLFWLALRRREEYGYLKEQALRLYEKLTARVARRKKG